MKLLRACLNILLIAFAVSASYAPMECKCYSKQPAMVRMHNKSGFTRCGESIPGPHIQTEQELRQVETAAYGNSNAIMNELLTYVMENLWVKR